MSEQKTFDEQYMPIIKNMVEYLETTKLWSIGLTVNFGGKDYDFKLEQVTDRFSEEHPYCKRECPQCAGGKHSYCYDTEKCHNTDEKCYWVDLD